MTEPYNELAAAIEEETQKARWRKIWNQFRIYIILLLAFVLGGAAVWSWKQNSFHKNALVYSNLYEEARALFEKNDTGQGVQKLQEIIKKGPANYRTMARFIMIDYYQSMNNISAMKEVYQAIIDDKKTTDFYRELAKINFIRFKLDHENPTSEHLNEFLKTLSEIYNPGVKKLALEIEGFVYYQLKDFVKARELFIQLAQTPDIDHEIRNRAQAMIRLIYMESTNASQQ
jgi:hypothetical protein